MSLNAIKTKEQKIHQIFRIFDVSDETLEIVPPMIDGYEDMPLVSLEEAIQPLIPYVSNIERYAEFAKQRCQKPPADGLTINESASIMLYSIGWKPLDKCLYILLNETLRSKDHEEIKAWFSYLKLFLNALSKLPSVHQYTYRGVLNDLGRKYKKDQKFVWSGFSSCTSLINALQSDGFFKRNEERTFFMIESYSAKNISKHSYYQGEDEYLFLPNTQFKVKATIYQDNRIHSICLQEVEQQYIFKNIFKKSSLKKKSKTKTTDVETKKQSEVTTKTSVNDVETKNESEITIKTPINDVEPKKQSEILVETLEVDVEPKKQSKIFVETLEVDVEPKKQNEILVETSTSDAETSTTDTETSTTDTETEEESEIPVETPKVDVEPKKQSEITTKTSVNDVETKNQSEITIKTPTNDVEPKKQSEILVETPKFDVEPKKQNKILVETPKVDVEPKKQSEITTKTLAKDVETKNQSEITIKTPANDVETKNESEKTTETPTNDVETKNEIEIVSKIPVVGKLSVKTESRPKPNINSETKWIEDGITIIGKNESKVPPFKYGSSMCIDENNEKIYIADYFNHSIIAFKLGETHPQIIAGAKGQGSKLYQLQCPTDVILDKDKISLIICDSGNRRVLQWPRQPGQIGQYVFSSIDCFHMTTDQHGYIFISDIVKHQVKRWKKGNSNGLLIAGGNGAGDGLDQLNCPSFIFAHDDDLVYVSDSFNNRIMQYKIGSKDGTVVAGGQGKGNSLSQLSNPQGLYVDDFDNIYIADCDNNRIMRWAIGAEEGEIILGGNGPGEQPNQFNGPNSLVFDRQGNLYVLDNKNTRVQKFNIDSD